ncbi:MAG: type II and III secretion system protein family protein [Henriciella sp.]
MMRANYLLKTAALAVLLGATPLASQAQNLMGVSTMEPGDTAVSKSIRLSLNKSTVIELGRPAADLVITNPDIADAVVQTSERLIFRGIQAGQTNAFIFDRNGNPLLNLEITVDLDTASLDQYISKYVPDARVNIEAVSGSIIITGQVDSLVQSNQVIRLVEAYMGGTDAASIVNMMSIAAKDQVMLEVRIVEMQRTVVKQLGINLSGSTSFDDFATTVSSSNGFNVQGNALGGLATEFGYVNRVGGVVQSSAGAAIDALERVGIVRTLAEPNIMAVSGESANFLAGGEFPVPVGSDDDGLISIEFKSFGVGLAFTPVVLSEGNISLKISTEISELSTDGAFQGSTVAGVDGNGNVVTASTLTIPSLTVRRAESTVELPSGGSTMLAGLIQSSSRQTIDQLPGIKKLPVLGALFQSRDFVNEETEMVVIVTPYLVDPARKDELRTPADGYVNASDPATILFGKLNAMYAEPGKGLSSENYTAPVGFIEE